MPQKGKAEKHWEQVIVDPNSSPEQKDQAARLLDRIKARHSRIKAARNRNKAKALENDKKPEFNEEEGYEVFWEKLAAWQQRHPEVKPTPAPKIEQPKPAPVIEVAAPPAPKPAPVKRACPVPVPVIKREPREGHSGKFFKEVFWALPIFERNMILKTLTFAEQSEWTGIEEQRAMKAAAVMAARPKETLKPLSEAEKRQAFSPTPMIQTIEAGQPFTVDEMRAKFGDTMGNQTPDSGLSVELDRRGERHVNLLTGKL
jgi:hypothetical protein